MAAIRDAHPNRPLLPRSLADAENRAVVDIDLGNGEHKQSVTQGSRRAAAILRALGIKDLDPVPETMPHHMA